MNVQKMMNERFGTKYDTCSLSTLVLTKSIYREF